jgi:hypothetical protein
MQVEKIKTKNWMEHRGTGAMAIGKKITIYTPETAELSILEIEKIEKFFKTLRA